MTTEGDFIDSMTKFQREFDKANDERREREEQQDQADSTSVFGPSPFEPESEIPSSQPSSQTEVPSIEIGELGTAGDGGDVMDMLAALVDSVDKISDQLAELIN
jgi:hypothetical protein